MTSSTTPVSLVPPAVVGVGMTVAIEGRTVLHDVDLRADAGSLTVLVGPNGAGKTTLLEALAGVRTLTAGTVTRAGRVAFVPQRAELSDALPLTVAEIVRMGAWRRPWGVGRSSERADAAAAMASLEISHLARRPVGALSGGQRQRALLAQTLARRAALLLLDEPTTGLDAGSSARILAAIAEERARGAAVVCVTHDPLVRDAADRVVRLDAGRVVA